jgi:hypothetical protein
MAYQPGHHAGEVGGGHLLPSLPKRPRNLSENQSWYSPNVLLSPFTLMKDGTVRSGPNQRHEFLNPTSVTNPLGEIIMNQEAHQLLGQCSASAMST